MERPESATEELAQAVIESQLGAVVRASEPILGKGSVNRLFRLRTSEGSVIARLNTLESLSQFRKEAWAMVEAKAAGVPTSQVLTIGERDGIAYLVVDDLGRDDARTAADAERVWHALGSHARAIHSIRTEGFGDAMSTPRVFDGDWTQFFEENLDALASREQLEAVLTPDEAARLHDAARALRGSTLTFALDHGDLSLRNAIVCGDSVAVIDWGSSEAQIVPHFDLIETLKSSFDLSAEEPGFQAFLTGYGIDGHAWNELLPELKALLTIKAVNKLRWASDRKPDRIKHYERYLRRIADYVLNMGG